MLHLSTPPASHPMKSGGRVYTEAVNLLQEHWRSWLVEACHRVFKKNVSADAATRLLPNMSSGDLLALDTALRQERTLFSQVSLEGDRGPGSISSDRVDTEAYLFVAACNADGFIRERALEIFAQYPGPLALTAALVRCDDWVAQVRGAATRLLRSLLADPASGALIERLDLLLALRNRRRFRDEAWDAFISSLLKVEDSLGRLWQWAHDGSWQVRKFALEVIAAVGDQPHREASTYAVQDRDLRVALWGLAHLDLEQGSSRELLLRAAAHPAPPVRASVMRLAQKVEADLARSLINVGLQDLARRPRSAAAYLLEHRFGQSALDYWRPVLKGSAGRQRVAALLGMCDIAALEDMNRIASDVARERALVRAAVLEGLWRARSPVLGDHLKRALFDPASTVVRRALQVYGKSTEPLSAEVLAQPIAAAKGPTLHALVRGVRLLEKWEGLYVLLKLAASLDSERRTLAMDELARWLASWNRRFTIPSPDTLVEIRKLTDTNLVGLGAARQPVDGAEENAHLWRAIADIVRGV